MKSLIQKSFIPTGLVLASLALGGPAMAATAHVNARTTPPAASRLGLDVAAIPPYPNYTLCGGTELAKEWQVQCCCAARLSVSSRRPFWCRAGHRRRTIGRSGARYGASAICRHRAECDQAGRVAPVVRYVVRWV